jgi:rubrerythrin
MAEQIPSEKAKKSFIFLADVEIKHQKSIFALYLEVSATDIDRAEFEKKIVVKAAEGGLTTDQYIALFGPSPQSTKEIAAVAISIEAQALDLYQRAALRSPPETGEVLLKIANEEQAHLNMLAQLFEES